MDKPKAIIANDHVEFRKICKLYGWDWKTVECINLFTGDTTDGFYRDEVYPVQPSLPERPSNEWISEEYIDKLHEKMEISVRQWRELYLGRFIPDDKAE